MNITDEIIDQTSQQMAKEIDRQILWGFLSESGWTHIKLERSVDHTLSEDINSWISENHKDEILQHENEFLFRNECDATMFVLRWA